MTFTSPAKIAVESRCIRGYTLTAMITSIRWLVPALAILIISCGGSSGADGEPVTPGQVPDTPAGSQWAEHMTSFGMKHCSFLKQRSGPLDPRLAATYYDAEWIYYQIADYTGDRKWLDCAQAAESTYRDEYVLPANGKVPGYWLFSQGLTVDAQRTGDKKSKETAILLSREASFARDDTPLDWTSSHEASREVAYVILSYLNAESLGEPRRARLARLADQAFGHIDQWVSGRASYVRPFMVGLTAQALIALHEHTGDPRTGPALTRAADWLWKNTWRPQARAFQYTDRPTEGGGTEPAPDLNLLVAPMYSWLYSQSRELKHRDRADEIFAGGTTGAWLENAKQFNQSYRWSFDFLRWRGK